MLKPKCYYKTPFDNYEYDCFLSRAENRDLMTDQGFSLVYRERLSNYLIVYKGLTLHYDTMGLHFMAIEDPKAFYDNPKEFAEDTYSNVVSLDSLPGVMGLKLEYFIFEAIYKLSKMIQVQRIKKAEKKILGDAKLIDTWQTYIESSRG